MIAIPKEVPHGPDNDNDWSLTIYQTPRILPIPENSYCLLVDISKGPKKRIRMLEVQDYVW